MFSLLAPNNFLICTQQYNLIRSYNKLVFHNFHGYIKLYHSLPSPLVYEKFLSALPHCLI